MTARRWSTPATPDEVRVHFGRERPLVGMVHLLPLPGSPRFGGSIGAVIERARADAEVLLAEGMDGVLVENFGDAPFAGGRVEAVTVAAMTMAVEAVRRVAGERPVGVNVLRNDAASALGVAAATGASFIRVNVHTGVMFTDQGVLEGEAHRTLRERERIAPDLLVLGDVLVKHAAAPAGIDPQMAAADLRERGLADILIASGARTGAPTDPARVEAVRRGAPGAPVWVGSGMTVENAAELISVADGVIVGSVLHRGGEVGRGIEGARVRALVEELRGSGGR